MPTLTSTCLSASICKPQRSKDRSPSSRIAAASSPPKDKTKIPAKTLPAIILCRKTQDPHRLPQNLISSIRLGIYAASPPQPRRRNTKMRTIDGWKQALGFSAKISSARYCRITPWRQSSSRSAPPKAAGVISCLSHSPVWLMMSRSGRAGNIGRVPMSSILGSRSCRTADLLRGIRFIIAQSWIWRNRSDIIVASTFSRRLGNNAIIEGEGVRYRRDVFDIASMRIFETDVLLLLLSSVWIHKSLSYE